MLLSFSSIYPDRNYYINQLTIAMKYILDPFRGILDTNKKNRAFMKASFRLRWKMKENLVYKSYFYLYVFEKRI